MRGFNTRAFDIKKIINMELNYSNIVSNAKIKVIAFFPSKPTVSHFAVQKAKLFECISFSLRKITKKYSSLRKYFHLKVSRLYEPSNECHQ